MDWIGEDYEWDVMKAASNLLKHGVDFATAEAAFDDPKRVIALDQAHSRDERRYYCFGKVGHGVLTVRFTLRGRRISIMGPVTGGKAGDSMKKRIRYTNEPIKAKIIKDFLPSPGTLRHTSSPMKVSYDKRSDTLTLRLRSGAVEVSDEVAPGIIVDRDASGGILGIELLDASKHGADAKAVEFAVS